MSDNLYNFFSSAKNYIFYHHNKSKETHDYEFHVQDGFEILFFISGNASCFIEKKVYQLKFGDLLVINSDEIHKVTFRSGETYERVVITFNPEIVSSYGLSAFGLLDCFLKRPKGERNKIELNKNQIDEIMGIFAKFNLVSIDQPEAYTVLKLAYLIEILAFLNKAFLNAESFGGSQSLSIKLDPILDHINNNLCSDLSLKYLGEKFYINKYYLSGLFKKETGLNIHEYITQKRIAKAKLLLTENYNIDEVCQLSGFSDYSHFIRAFKQHVGTSPGRYKKQYPLRWPKS